MQISKNYNNINDLKDTSDQFNVLRRNNFEVHYSCFNKDVDCDLLKVSTKSIKKYVKDNNIYFDIVFVPYLRTLNELRNFLHSSYLQLEIAFYPPDYAFPVFSETYSVELDSVFQYDMTNDNSDSFNVAITFKRKRCS